MRAEQNTNQREWPKLDKNTQQKTSRSERGGVRQQNYTRHFYPTTNSRQSFNNAESETNYLKRGRPPSFESPIREHPPPPGLLHLSPTGMDQSTPQTSPIITKEVTSMGQISPRQGSSQAPQATPMDKHLRTVLSPEIIVQSPVRDKEDKGTGVFT